MGCGRGQVRDSGGSRGAREGGGGGWGANRGRGAIAATKVPTTPPPGKNANPVIQLNKNQFLDIRALRMYKANHATELSGRNNIEINRTGAGRIEVVALRNIYEDEELFWEYAP